MLRKQSRNNLQLRKNNQGMTLIEVIAVVAVLGVVMAAVLGFMITGTKMSAQVSGTATDSIKEQTAVEFINRRILSYDISALELYEEIKDEDGNATENYSGLLIELSEQNGVFTYALLATENETVVFKTGQSNVRGMLTDNIKTIEICPGEIYFENIKNNTVIYHLNDEIHVVHLRVAGATS